MCSWENFFLFLIRFIPAWPRYQDQLPCLKVQKRPAFILIKCASNIYGAQRCRFAVDLLISRGRFCLANISTSGSETGQNWDWIHLNDIAWSHTKSSSSISSQLQWPSSTRCSTPSGQQHLSLRNVDGWKVTCWTAWASSLMEFRSRFALRAFPRVTPPSFRLAYN